MHRNLHIFLSPFTHESRVLKESKSLINSGLVQEVLIVALWEKGLKETEQIDEGCFVWRISIKSRIFPKNLFIQLFKYFEWIFRIIWGLRNKQINTIHCHSLSSLPIGVLIKWLKRKKLIYDAHELETERNNEYGLRQYFSRLTERFFIRFTDVVIVVTESIADWYETKYKISRPIVMRNIPRKSKEIDLLKSRILKDKFNISDKEILYIYQGALANGRNIEKILSVFSRLNRKNHIVFMGRGRLEKIIKKFENEFPNIHFQTSVMPDEILKYTSSADVGIAIPENNCLSHYYGLGNKHFEYILSGLPIIVSNFPERAKLVNENNFGWTVEPNEFDLLQLIKDLSLVDLKIKKQNIINKLNKFTWENEEVKLLEVYQSLISNNN